MSRVNDKPGPIVAPWHRLSWDELLNKTLPDLLAQRIPLAGYEVDVEEGSATCKVQVFVATDDGEVENSYDVPYPDPRGVFIVGEGTIVVPPIAQAVDLAEAEVACCGESALSFICDRLRDAPDERPADAEEARRWLPLDKWLTDFVSTIDYLHAPQQSRAILQCNNWLDTSTHLRRIAIPDREQVITDGHLGRVCVIETPEGPNIGRILSVARGAEIRERKLVIVDDSPAGKLGLTSACIPFLEHDDINRALMGANMMRQWLQPAETEEAVIRTGFEPDADGFWCGHNLLTAFITWDADCFEDAIVVSESAAKRMACPEPLAVGDKLSHRHGAKGVVSRIMPDGEMPCLQDGTAVELIFSLCGLPSRLSMGALREAVLSRVAASRNEYITVRPFESPSEVELRRILEEAGLPSDGMEQLSLDDKALTHRSTVGWVYWGCTVHRAKNKLHFATSTSELARWTEHPGDAHWFRPQALGELEAMVLHDVGATETIREQYNTRAVEGEGADSLVERLVSGHVEQAVAPTPQFAHLQKRLAATGISLTLNDHRLAIEFADPETPRLELAEPTAHPWMPEHRIGAISRMDTVSGWDSLEEANERLARALASKAPAGLLDRTRAQLSRHLASFCDVLVSPAELQFHSHVVFSARSVIAPGGELDHNQIGVPEEAARALFAPLVARRMGFDAPDTRSAEATAALDEAMADTWIIMFRPPALTASCFIAFRPVRVSGNAIRLHPLATLWTNADFDGDQVALFLPVTEAGQREAGERLTLDAHLRNEPGVLRGDHAVNRGYRGWLYGDAMWGLAHLALTSEGRKQIDDAAGRPICGERRVVTNAGITEALGDASDSVQAHERLQRLGFQVARRSGGSMGPFFGSSMDLPDKPLITDDDSLEAYSWEVQAVFEEFADFDNDEVGPICLGYLSGSRASKQQLSMLAGARVGRYRSPFSQREGQPPEHFFCTARDGWEGIFRMNERVVAWNAGTWEGLELLRPRQVGRGLLSRARAARRPGVVLARAAHRGETDPLTDSISRLWVGLGVDD